MHLSARAPARAARGSTRKQIIVKYAPHYNHIRGSIVVSISACHAEDLGSIPGRGVWSYLLADEARWQTDKKGKNTCIFSEYLTVLKLCSRPLFYVTQVPNTAVDPVFPNCDHLILSNAFVWSVWAFSKPTTPATLSAVHDPPYTHAWAIVRKLHQLPQISIAY